MTHLLLRWAILALGVALATQLIPGIHCVDASALILVALLLSFFNAILKPVLVLFTLPFILVTLGFGIVVINAMLFLLAAHLVPGFEVHGFWSAVGGAIVVSLTNFLASRLLQRRPPQPRTPADSRMTGRPPAGRRQKPADVIDI